jgi:hypothetical protein
MYENYIKEVWRSQSIGLVIMILEALNLLLERFG